MATKRTTKPVDNGHVDTEKKKKKEESGWTWTHEPAASVYIGHRLMKPGDSSHLKTTSNNIAAFDFDGTLCTTRSGSVFPKDGNDFKLWSDKLPKIMKDLQATHSIVIFTNQMGVHRKKITIEQAKKRLEGSLDLLDQELKCAVFVAVAENSFRKPRRGMVDLWGISFDPNSSFYVGDAAGREKTKDRKKDHSNSDFLFALNVGFNFMTPEQFVDLGSRDDITPERIKKMHERNATTLPTPSFNPLMLRDDTNKSFEVVITVKGSKDNRRVITGIDTFQQELQTQTSGKKSVIVVMTGLPGSGKSWFVNNFLPEYIRVSRDVLGTMEKCAKQLRTLCQESQTCRAVVDNTSTEVQARKTWVDIGRENKVDCLVSVSMNVTLDQCLHNNSFRRLVKLEEGDSTAAVVPTFVIHKQAKGLVIPETKEGFDVVFEVTVCVPRFSPGSNLEKLYFQFL